MCPSDRVRGLNWIEVSLQILFSALDSLRDWWALTWPRSGLRIFFPSVVLVIVVVVVVRLASFCELVCVWGGL